MMRGLHVLPASRLIEQRSEPFAAETDGGREGRGGGRRRGGGGFGSVVDAGAVLFALTPAGQLTVIEPNGRKLNRIASYKVAEEGTYAYPVIAGSRIFIKDANSVALWTID